MRSIVSRCAALLSGAFLLMNSVPAAFAEEPNTIVQKEAHTMQTYRQMLTELDAIGVKPIEAVGKEFDPEFHNAVMQVESEEYDSGIVAQELQKGYIYHDSVVRHSMVAVVQ